MIEWLNDNQGVLSAVGFFLVIPFALLSDRIIEGKKKKEYQREMALLLINELWQNLNYVSQIEDSYRANLTDKERTHIPHHPPRVEVIEKFFQQNLIASLSQRDKALLMEIFAHLSGLKELFTEWKALLYNTNVRWDEGAYVGASSSMLSYVSPLMRNMMTLWVYLLADFGFKSTHMPVQAVSNRIDAEIKNGKWIQPAYRSSEFKTENPVELAYFDVLLCWEHDWNESGKEVIEIRNMAALHETWEKAERP